MDAISPTNFIISIITFFWLILGVALLFHLFWPLCFQTFVLSRPATKILTPKTFQFQILVIWKPIEERIIMTYLTFEDKAQMSHNSSSNWKLAWPVFTYHKLFDPQTLYLVLRYNNSYILKVKVTSQGKNFLKMVLYN